MKKARLNIYVDEPDICKEVKMAAAKRDLSISEYCLQAITSKLIADGERTALNLSRAKVHDLSKAVAKARRFQAEVFGGRIFSVSSASLIAQARKERSKTQ